MANGAEVGRAYITIVPVMNGAQQEITKELTGVTDSAAKSAGESGGTNFGTNFASAIKGTAAVITGALAAATAAAVGSAVAAGKAFLNAANDVSETGDRIDKLSQKMNISASAFQEWDFILQHCGASIESMKAPMKTLATAAEKGNDAFKELGISQQDIANMNQEELFAATIEGLQNVTDDTRRTYLASQLLGKGATELGALFNMSAAETENMRKQVRELGGMMSDSAVKDAAEYQDQLQNMNVALTGVKNKMMSEFLPGLSQVMKGLSQVFSGNENGIAVIEGGLQNVIAKITEVAPQFFSLGQTIVLSLINGFGPMIGPLVSSIFDFLNKGLLAISSLIPSLTPAITSGIKSLCGALFNSLPIIFDSLLDMVKDIVTWLASGKNLKTFTDGILKLVSMLAVNLADALPILLPAIITIVGEIAKSLTEPANVKLVVESALYVVGAVAMALVQSFPQILDLIKDLFKNIWNRMKDESGLIIAFVVTMLQKLISNVSSWFGNLISNITSKLGEVWTGIKTWFSNLPGKIENAFTATKNTIKGWATSAVQWGKDMIQGFINGIKNSASKMASVIKNFAKDNISKFLHFSVPDAGPLADADKWMPDMVSLMVKGLEKGAPEIRAAVQDFASGMNANINAYGPQGALLGDSTTYNGGAITINVYGAEGQNVNDLAQSIAQRLEDMARRKELAYA